MNDSALRAEFLRLERESRKTQEVPGFSSHDLAEALGVTQHVAHRMIADQMDRGKLRYAGLRRTVNRIMRTFSVPIYQFVPEGRAAKGRKGR